MQVCSELLQYCISDLDPGDAATPLALIGLPLLVAADNSVVEISYNSESSKVLFLMAEEDARVLAQVEDSILVWKVSTPLLKELHRWESILFL